MKKVPERKLQKKLYENLSFIDMNGIVDGGFNENM